MGHQSTGRAGIFNLLAGGRIEIGDLQQVKACQGSCINTDMRRVQPDHSDAATLTAAAVVHLAGSGQHVPPGDRHIGGKAQHPTATFSSLRRPCVHRRARCNQQISPEASDFLSNVLIHRTYQTVLSI